MGPRKETQEHPQSPHQPARTLRLPIPAPSLSHVLATLQELLSPPPHPTYLPLPCLCCSSLIFYLRVLQWVIQEWKILLTKEKGFPFSAKNCTHYRLPVHLTVPEIKGHFVRSAHLLSWETGWCSSPKPHGKQPNPNLPYFRPLNSAGWIPAWLLP